MQERETIYAQNISQFKMLVFAVRSFGAVYKPGSEMLKISNLETVLNDAELAMKDVRHDTAMLADAARRRETVFNGLGKLAARIGYALEISSVYYLIGSDAQRIIYKLQGKYAVEKALTPAFSGYNAVPKMKTASKLSFESRIVCFERLIKLLESEQAAYAPEEEDLIPAALHFRLKEMREANAAVMSAADALSSSRMLCGEVLFDRESGLVAVADLVVKYIQYAFGTKSEQYRKVRLLEFDVA